MQKIRRRYVARACVVVGARDAALSPRAQRAVGQQAGRQAVGRRRARSLLSPLLLSCDHCPARTHRLFLSSSSGSEQRGHRESMCGCVAEASRQNPPLPPLSRCTGVARLMVQAVSAAGAAPSLPSSGSSTSIAERRARRQEQAASVKRSA